MPTQHLLEPAVQIIDELFGPVTANQYRTFYAGKTDLAILTLLNDMLREVVGPGEAQARTSDLRRKLKEAQPSTRP